MSNTSLLGSFGGQAGDALFFRNRIINGCMRIDQRFSGAAVTPTNGQYTVDRWGAYAFGSATSKFTVQQNAGAVTPPPGFSNYLGITSTSAYTVAAGDITAVYQVIEGHNVADLDFGTANARTISLSFWVRSSLTGTFGGSLMNASVNRAYPFTYSISSANTWEYKTITIAGDVAGTWNKTNGQGLFVVWSLGTGSNFSGPAGAWAGSAFYAPTGATSVVGTSGATLYITGVQLESGTATPFERRPYSVELGMAQRYYWRVENKGATADVLLGLAMGQGANTALFAMSLPVTMRAIPAISGSCVVANANASIVDPSTAFSQILSQTGVAGTVITCTNSSLTANAVYRVLLNSATAFFAANAEL